MRVKSSILFPPGTLRRLLAKFLQLFLRHPVIGLRCFRFGRVFLGLKYIWQREFALLEDRITYLLQEANVPRVHPGTDQAEDGTTALAGPFIRLAVYVTRKTLSALPLTLASLARQSYTHWELVFVHAPDVKREHLANFEHPGPAGSGAEIIPLSELARLWQRGDYIGILPAGDTLTPQALARMVFPTMGALPDLIYCDEEEAELRAGDTQFCKPDWSPRLLLGMNYIGNFFLLKRERLAGVSPGPDTCSPEGLYDLLLKCTDQPAVVKHVPALLHYTGGKRTWRRDRGEKILSETLARRKLAGDIRPLQRPGAYRVRRHLTGEPRVSIIVLTAMRRRGMLRRCLSALQRRTTYRNIQVIVVDNSSEGRAHQEIPEGLTVTQIPYADKFNYSRMNNLAATRAEGDYLVFLNDDTEILTPDWLETLLEQAQVAQTGVVGCQLLYPNGMIQHAGMFLVRQGAGARHAFRHLRRVENSYQGLGAVVRECSAVTFACAMVPRNTFQSLGGLDEQLPVECNDLDFCLRAGQQGYGIIYTPFSRVHHAELVSRRRTHVSEDIAYFKQRWQWLQEAGDPFYNPNLSEDSDFYRPGRA